jgi:hypothetical protein
MNISHALALASYPFLLCQIASWNPPVAHFAR